MVGPNTKAKILREAQDCDHTSTHMANDEEEPCYIPGCKFVGEYSCPNCGLMVCDDHFHVIEPDE